jgi:hypothetical protein
MVDGCPLPHPVIAEDGIIVGLFEKITKESRDKVQKIMELVAHLDPSERKYLAWRLHEYERESGFISAFEKLKQHPELRDTLKKVEKKIRRMVDHP